MNYRLRLYPYCGGYIDLIDDDTLGACRRHAAWRIRRHRNVYEYPVTILERGLKWELETGEDAFLISDAEGILCIEELPETAFDDEEEG